MFFYSNFTVCFVVVINPSVLSANRVDFFFFFFFFLIFSKNFPFLPPPPQPAELIRAFLFHKLVYPPPCRTDFSGYLMILYSQGSEFGPGGRGSK